MTTTIQIDDHLIQKAVKLGGHKSKKAAVSQALIEYIQRLEQEKLITLFGTVDYDQDYDYKQQRKKMSHPLGILKGKARMDIKPDFSMTDEELLS